MSNLLQATTANIIDPLNTTNRPLLANGVFEGGWIDTTKFGIAYVSIFTDVESAEDGLCVIQSTNGVYEDHDDCYNIPANKGKNFSVNLYAKFLKVKYTNGSSDQSVFRLQVMLKETGKPSSHRIKDDIVSDDDAELVKAILSVETNDEEIYSNINVNNPMPSDGDSVYAKDIIIDLSNQGGFTITSDPTADKRGILSSLVSDAHLEKKDDSATNPKSFTLTFKRPILTSSFGMDSGPLGTFSNVKITIYQSQYSEVLLDESLDSTTYYIRLFEIPPIKFNKMLVEFHTANAVTIGMIGIFKYNDVAARLQALSDSGNVIDVSSTNEGNLKMAVMEYGDTPSIDAFDRLRVSEPFTIFDSKQLHDKQPLFWDEITAGSATSTHNSANACTEMVVTASASDYVQRQTKQRFNYQPGKGQLILFTFFADIAAGVTMRIGCFDGTGVNYLDPNNGVFLEINGTTDISWNIAKNGTITETVTQSNWNVDKLDGSGSSGIDLNLGSAQIGVIDFEALLVGRVRCGFVIDGIIRYSTYLNHANDPTFTSAYFSTPNLPLRYSIESDGTSAGELDHICSTVMSEGGIEETGILRSVDTGNVHVDANAADTTYAVVGVRLKSTHLDITVYPEFMTMISETNDDFKWSLLLNPTVAGTFTYSDVTNSSIQYATGATANTVSAYELQIDSGYAQSNASVGHQFVTQLRIGSQIDGTRDTLVLCVTPLAANADIQGTLTVRELL